MQLIVACTVLGLGVAFLLEAALGSDGYSSLVNGLTLASGQPFWLINIVVGAVFITVAWVRGTRPGPGTVVQWFLVGLAIPCRVSARAGRCTSPRDRTCSPACISIWARTEDLALSLARVWAKEDAVNALDEWAHHIARSRPKILTINRVIERARSTDEDAAGLWHLTMRN